ncbi:MAG: hypothetical protein IIX01_02330 [Clostridia bacterium]|nr:hypothetical protein [Clostridia bacterium]
MSALAKFLLKKGCTVYGYDEVKGEQAEELLFSGVKISFDKQEIEKEFYDADAVVYSDAISPADVRRKEAEKLHKPLMRRVEFLSLVCQSFTHSLAVGGSHGKTTCTAMCTHIFERVGVSFAAHIGGEDLQFGNFYQKGDGTPSYFITEACEYKKNMLDIRAERAILLNIDCDHMECYDGEEDLTQSFYKYCENAEEGFVNADDERCVTFGRKFITFGIKNPHCDYRAEALRSNGERYSFTVREYGKTVCRIRLKTAGKHNVYNALAAFAAARSYGFSEKEIAEGLESFTAVKRRFESIGEIDGVKIVCDYAHHPREIQATLQTAQKICKGELFVVFQPHTYSRTRLLMQEFVEVLRPVKRLMIYKTYPAREFYDEEGSAKRLATTVGNCLYAESVKQIKAWLKSSAKSGDAVLFLGAGDVYFAAKFLVSEL